MQEWVLGLRVEKIRTPEGVTALVVAPEGEGDVARPLVLVVHGAGSRKERHLELCLLLAQAGLVACTLDACGHGERQTPDACAALAAGGAVFAAFFAEAVAATAAELPLLAARLGAARYGVVGHSMGAFIALKALTQDPKIAAVASISGNPDWALQAEMAGMPPAVVEQTRAVSPLTHAAHIWPRPLLLLHGDADTTVPITGARRLYKALASGPYADSPDRLQMVEYPGVGHEFLPDMAGRAAQWMQRFLVPESSGL